MSYVQRVRARIQRQREYAQRDREDVQFYYEPDIRAYEDAHMAVHKTRPNVVYRDGWFMIRSAYGSEWRQRLSDFRETTKRLQAQAHAMDAVITEGDE